MKTVGVYEAKTNLAELLNRVDQGESFTITRHGSPVAVLARPLEACNDRIGEAIDAIRAHRSRFSFDGLNVKELIEEGRR